MFPADEIRFSVLDLVFIWLGLGTFLLDLGTDAWVAFSFYWSGDYFWGSAVLVLVFLCSAVVQLFSWFWFAGDRQQLESYSNSGRLPKLKVTPGDRVLGLLHWLQLGFLVRSVSNGEAGGSEKLGVNATAHVTIQHCQTSRSLNC